jgi:hypothetical protein
VEGGFMSFNLLDKMGIGVMTRNRFNYLEKCIKTLMSYNNSLEYYSPLIIGDDASNKNVCSKIWHLNNYIGDDDEDYILHFLI